jgi:MraZ protein
VARFFGRYEHSLDPKGRVILPSKFRAHFEMGGYLTQFHDRCLALWTPEDFHKQMETMELKEEQGRTERNLARFWAQGTAEVDVDRQGRMVIPPYLREFARLDGDVLVNGAISRVELWSPTVWAQKVAAAERRLTEDDEEDDNEPARAT